MDGSQQAFDFAQAHFNTMDPWRYQWENYPVSAIQDFRNAGMTPLRLQRLAQVEFSPTPAYCSADWTEANTHEDWFIHDGVTGSRIWNPSDDGFLMDIGNAGFRHIGSHTCRNLQLLSRVHGNIHRQHNRNHRSRVGSLEDSGGAVIQLSNPQT